MKRYCRNGVGYTPLAARIYAQSLRDAADGPDSLDDPRNAAEAGPCPYCNEYHVYVPTADAYRQRTRQQRYRTAHRRRTPPGHRC
jgi:hypothetical protein